MVKWQVPYKIVLSSLLFGLGYLWLWSLFFSFWVPTQGIALPWHVLVYVYYYGHLTSKTQTGLLVAGLAPMVLIGLFAMGGYRKRRLAKLYGNARWASFHDLKKNNFFAKAGFIIGKWRTRLLCTELQSHILIFAPSRSGKGVSHVIPNGLCWPGSLLVTDIKLEVFGQTSGFRAQYGEVYLFSPNHPEGKTHCWNPLDLIDRQDISKRVAQIQLIVNLLIPLENDRHDMWVEEARSIATGLLLCLMEKEGPLTIGELVNLVKGTEDLNVYLKAILKQAVIADTLVSLNPIAFQSINNYLQKADKERSGVRSTLTARLNLWDDPYINAATSRSDFDIRDMRKKRMTIYLGIQPNQLKRLAPLMNLFTQLFASTLSETLPTKDEPHRVLMLLDEFCNLGRMPILQEGFSYLAGYHVHLVAVIQNLSQGYALYGQYGFESIMANTDIKICTFQNDETGKAFVSKQLGQQTVRDRSQSSPGGIAAGFKVNYTQFYKSKPLLTPDEVAHFPKDKAIAIVSGQAPIVFKRLLYYQDPAFSARLLPTIIINPIEPLLAKMNNLPVACVKEAKSVIQSDLTIPMDTDS